MSFENDLLAVSNGELGINLLKKLDQDLCFITAVSSISVTRNLTAINIWS